MAGKSIIIMASQRSGTVGLGLGLQNSFQVQWLGEVFQEIDADDIASIDDRKRDTSFFLKRIEILKKEAGWGIPSETNQKSIFETYLRMMAKDLECNDLIVDVKYGSWHHLNSFWLMPQQRPGLAKIVRELELPVVHVIRENLFRQYCSLMFAIQTGQWHVASGEKPKKRKIEIDVKNCEDRMRSVEFARNWYRSHFTNYENYFELTYEEMFTSGKISDAVFDLFSRLLEQEPEREELVPIGRTTPSLRDLILNSDDVLRHFDGTAYGAMVESALKG